MIPDFVLIFQPGHIFKSALDTQLLQCVTHYLGVVLPKDILEFSLDVMVAMDCLAVSSTIQTLCRIGKTSAWKFKGDQDQQGLLDSGVLAHFHLEVERNFCSVAQVGKSRIEYF